MCASEFKLSNGSTKLFKPKFLRPGLLLNPPLCVHPLTFTAEALFLVAVV